MTDWPKVFRYSSVSISLVCAGLTLIIVAVQSKLTPPLAGMALAVIIGAVWFVPPYLYMAKLSRGSEGLIVGAANFIMVVFVVWVGIDNVVIAYFVERRALEWIFILPITQWIWIVVIQKIILSLCTFMEWRNRRSCKE